MKRSQMRTLENSTEKRIIISIVKKCFFRSEQVDKVIGELNYDLPGGAVLLCCLLNFLDYSELTCVIEYFINHFNEVIFL